MLSSALWKHFSVFQLTAPVRNASDPAFADFIDRIGEDTSSARICLDNYIMQSDNGDSLQDELFPDNILSNPELCVRRAFLTPLNIDVDRFNVEILERLPGNICTMFSF